jgi:hypothetical protein
MDAVETEARAVVRTVSQADIDQMAAAIAAAPMRLERREPTLICSFVMPTGEAYRAWDDTGGALTGDEIDQMTVAIARAAKAGQPMLFSNGIRLEAITPTPAR